MERRTDFFDVQRHVARKIGNTEATAQINERRASVCFLGQSCGKPQRRTLSINNGVGVQSLRHGQDRKRLVEGKQVAVRVSSGGRGSIKKKNKIRKQNKQN